MNNHVVIFREGDKDEKDGVILGDIRPDFVRCKKNKERVVVFVGMYSYKTKDNENVTIYSLPKYFPKEKCQKENIFEIKKHIKKICRVIEKLRAEGKLFDDTDYIFNPYEQKKEDKNIDRADLAEYIIEDYLQNGLYLKELTESKKGGIGRTNWAKTVTKIRPIIQNGIPIYIELMNKHHIVDEDDFMSIIHANVLNQCLEFMGSLISEGIDPIETECLGEDLSAFASAINVHSTYVFKEREINLFKALEAWCNVTKYYENFVGTTCFDRIWEWVNDSVWGNVGNPNSDNPIYYIGDGSMHRTYYGVGEAIPDTIRIERTDTGSQKMYIYDAKYYTINQIRIENGFLRIYGFPANSDIVKQVAYLKLIKSQYIADSFFNSFILPEAYKNYQSNNEELFQVLNDDWFRVIGYVKPGRFHFALEKKEEDNNLQHDEEKVGIIMVKPEKLYDKYLANKKVNYEELVRTEDYLK